MTDKDYIAMKLDDEDKRQRVKLVQSGRFPNLWSLEDMDGRSLGTWRDTMFANGALSSEDAVQYANRQNWRIIEVLSAYWDELITDPRNGHKVDTARDVIEGHEYRLQRTILEPLLYKPVKEVTDNG